MENMEQTVSAQAISPEATNLVASGEAVFKSLTGKEMSTDQQKVSDGITKIVDGLLPTIERNVHGFSLSDVIQGITSVLNGVSLVITGAKTPNHPQQEVSAVQDADSSSV